MGFIHIGNRPMIRSMRAESNWVVWAQDTWFYNEDVGYYMFDLRNVAQTLVNHHGEAYIDRIHFKRTVFEKKNGGGALCGAANVARGGWRNIESIYSCAEARNLGLRGSGVWTWFNTDRNWAWSEYDIDASANPWPASLLATDPLFLREYFPSSGSRKVAVGWDFYITHIQAYIFRPGFPGWATVVMSQNGKAVPGWVSQVISGNWLTAYTGGKQYLTAL